MPLSPGEKFGIIVLICAKGGGGVFGWRDFFTHLNGWRLLSLALSAVAVVLCMSIHELSHGYAAYKLGDTTAKEQGRLSLNPFRHLDLVGALMLLVVGVGWAKPVSVDPRHFKDPKKGMALTALAGPVSNLLLTFAALLICSFLLNVVEGGGIAVTVLYCFFCHLAVRSLGLGLFNLIPISPLDGSKVLLAVLPERAYWKVLRYERYGFAVVMLLAWSGAFDGALAAGIQAVLGFFCTLARVPLESVLYGSYLFQIMG